MRPWVLFAAASGLMAVAMGAYSAHGLAAQPALAALGERASLYQLLHALAILGADRLAAEGRRPAHWAAAGFALGIVLFSGSLYWKILAGPLPVPMITPIGGFAFMAGWLALGASALVPARG